MNKKILLVDDSITILKKLNNVINETIGLQVLTAKTKKEAYNILKESSDEIIFALLDISLPDAPNGEVVPLVANKYKIPSIILTGTHSEEKRKRLKIKGVIDYILKDRSTAFEQAAKVIKRYIDNEKHQVLIVDDSKTYAKKIELIVKKHNLENTTVHSGEEALNEVKKGIYSLVFLDYIMPGIDGLETITEIRKIYPSERLPIIALSGLTEKNVIPNFLKFGSNDFLYKDSTEEEFVARMTTQLNMLELFRKAKDEAQKDFMTGMFNRRYMFEFGLEMYQRAKSKNEFFAAAILDIDKFKNINDTYGHDIGDIAIKAIAEIVPKYIKGDVMIARMGGEEFCVLIRGRDKENVSETFENVRNAIEENVIKIKDLNLQYTISTGATMDFSESFNDMLKLADDALYEAKETGRNKTIFK